MFLAGDGYVLAVSAMMVITVAIIPNGLTGILGTQVLTSIEREKYVLYSVIVGAVTDFILNLFFIPILGATGAALATVICEFAVLFMQIYFCRDLIAKIIRYLKPFSYIIFTLVATLVVMPIKLYGIESYFLCLLFSAVIFFGAYILCLLITKDELAMQLLSEMRLLMINRKKKN